MKDLVESMKQKRNILFICNTPYQIIVALAIGKYICKDDNVDIIITNHMNNSEKWANKLECIGLFNKILLVNNKNCVYGFKYERYIKKTYCALSECRKLSDLNLTFYDELYTYNTFCFEQGVFSKLKKMNNQLKVYLFEDGLATYIGNMMESLKNKGMKKVLYNITSYFGNGFEIYDSIEGIYLFNPKAIHYELPFNIHGIFDGYSLEESTRLLQCEFKEILNIVFDYDIRELSEIVFFEEPQLEPQFYSLLNDVIHNFNSLNIDIKPHPRSQIDIQSRKIYGNMKIIEDGFLPWEVICLNQEMEKKVLISLRSSALFTPKMIFNQEPVLIWLFNIFPSIIGDEELLVKLSNNVEMLRRSYKHPERVIVPKNTQELIDFLRKYFYE